MGVTYVNPLEGMQKGFKTLGEGIGSYREKKQDRKRIEEILAGLDPETAKNFVGYTDPQKLGEAIVTNKRSLADDDRANKEFEFKKEQAASAAKTKEAEDEYNRAKTEYNDLGILTDDQYVERINTLNKKYGKDYSYEANPEYDPKAKGDAVKPKYRVQGLTKPEKEVESYKTKKSFDDTIEQKKEVRSLKDKTTFEGTQQKNKIEAIKKTGEQARITKGTPTFTEKTEAEYEDPAVKQNRLLLDMQKRLQEKLKQYGY